MSFGEVVLKLKIIKKLVILISRKKIDKIDNSNYLRDQLRFQPEVLWNLCQFH